MIPARQFPRATQHCRTRWPLTADAPLDLLWKEYSLGFRDFDDLTLARWLAQTLGQLAGQRLAPLASAAGRLPPGRAVGPRPPDLAQAPGRDPARLLRITLLPRADVAVAHARRARGRPDLPALQRDARPVRRNPRRRCKRDWRTGPRNTPPSTPSPTGTTASARPPATTTTPTKAPRKKPRGCSRRPAASLRPGCSSSMPRRSGKTRTSASKCGRRMCNCKPIPRQCEKSEATSRPVVVLERNRE